MSDCDPMIPDLFDFPRRPGNRPALPRIAYRIGEYPDMVEAMLRHLDGEVALSGWTHRGADDPGIALLEGVGIIGDILTFYQERYANEAFLRTSGWRESVAGLVRLLGYRLSPGLGGHATLAVELKEKAGRVVVPAGYAFKADLEGAETAAEFQTDAELVAWPHLSAFNLYRPRSYAPSIVQGTTQVEFFRAGGSTHIDDLTAVDIKKGDRILLRPAAPGWSTSATAAFNDQQSSQIVEVKEVRQVHDRMILTFDTALDRTWPRPITAYRLGRTWRHFGHGLGPTYTEPIPATGEITGTRTRTTGYLRHIHRNHACANTEMAFDIPGRMIPLDQEVTDLAAGRRVAISLRAQKNGVIRDVLFVRQIARLRASTITCGPQTGPSTLLTLSSPLITYTQNPDIEADIRDYRIHEITSPRMRLRPVAGAGSGAIPSATDALNFFGTRREVRKLVDRPIALTRADGTVAQVTVISDKSDFTGGQGRRKMWPLSFDDLPEGFVLQDFDEEAPRVTVHGNLVEASQGKAVARLPLGNGDARAAFQTFALPKPVTHLLSPGADPAEVPELTVYVNDRAVDRVGSLYGQPGDRLVYILRQDNEGAFHVQFGDGLTGARLPTGKGNVTAAFRTGSGARGPLKAGTSPSAGARIEGVARLAIPAGVTGGADPETTGNARAAAPGRVQGLGRIVSLADYETELLAIPGVSRVRAAWDLMDGAPGVVLRVLLESGREAEMGAVEDAIYAFQRCRGSNRFALRVEQAVLRQVYADLRYAFDPALLEEDVAAAITRRLAPMEAPDAEADGVFALGARRIGGAEYASRIEGLVQAVPGVTWVRVEALGLLPPTPAGTLPEEIDLPPAPRARHQVLAPGAAALLQLHGAHLTLTSAPPPPGGEC